MSQQRLLINAMILDIGCGYGRILQGLHSCGYTNLTGIDISKNMLQRGKKEAPHLNFAPDFCQLKSFSP